ncbi:MAG: phage major capsid protein [Dehalobacter sp. 4CP]|nr:phage major capsid protein [Dehalobacter sp. 4CP]
MQQSSLAYNNAFWRNMRIQDTDASLLREGRHATDTYYLPTDFVLDFTKSLQEENLFRRLATLAETSSESGRIIATSSDGNAEFSEDGEEINESADTLVEFPFESYKLAALTRIRENFMHDNAFDLKGYLRSEFSRRFGRAEENAFINGNGENQPTGLLHETNGAETGRTTASPDAITFDDVIALHQSLKPKYRKRAVWLMNDDTAMQLRFLKDSSGNPLWNHSNDSIFSKQVIISPFMPSITAGAVPIAIGDLKYYWYIQRQNLAAKVLWELFSKYGHIGIIATERVDGLLIRREAVKALKMAE